MIMKSLCFFLSFLVVVSVAAQDDSAAMLVLSRAFQRQPPQWSSFAYCKWKGVKCNHHTRGVISLNIDGLSLGGLISPEIGQLSGLEEVYLQNNNLTGELPWSLAALPSLRILDVSNNNLTGEVPEFAKSVKIIYRPGNLSLKDRSSSGNAIVGAFIILSIAFYAALKLRVYYVRYAIVKQ